MKNPLTIIESFGPENIEAVRRLRYEILREPLGMSYESTWFSGDDRVDTMHLLACDGDSLAGCLSLLFTSHESPHCLTESGSDLQLRGMAVATVWQRHGVGRSLIHHAHSIADRAHRGMWCNARQSAIGFYERHGWRTVGESFDIPTIGLHKIMRRDGKSRYGSLCAEVLSPPEVRS